MTSVKQEEDVHHTVNSKSGKQSAGRSLTNSMTTQKWSFVYGHWRNPNGPQAVQKGCSARPQHAKRRSVLSAVRWAS